MNITKIIRTIKDFLRDECGAWFITLLVALAFQVIAYLLAPKPKKAKPTEHKDLENPTADAGRPLPVVFGTVIVKGVNVLWYGAKDKDRRDVDA